MRYEVWQNDDAKWVLYDTVKRQIIIITRDKSIIQLALARLSSLD